MCSVQKLLSSSDSQSQVLEKNIIGELGSHVHLLIQSAYSLRDVTQYKLRTNGRWVGSGIGHSLLAKEKAFQEEGTAKAKAERGGIRGFVWRMLSG